jgi:hypothetical protein
MPAKNQLEPYKLVHGIELRFSDVADTLDEHLKLGFEDAGDEEDGGRRLDLRGERWNGLVVTVEARLDSQKIASVLAGGRESAGETRMVVSIRCPSTKLRRVVELLKDPADSDAWAGDVRLERRDVRSRVEFHPLLYRTTELPVSRVDVGELAHHRFALLATGQPTSISIDNVERSPGGPISIKWRDFADGRHPWLEKYKQTMYYFEYDEAKPTLWLNSRHRNLRALLFERTEDTVDSGMRRLLSGWFAEVVWLQLFQAAVASLTPESEGGGMEVPDGWRGDVLKKFAINMFPEQTTREALSSLAEARASSDQFGVLMGKASSVVQWITGSEKLFTAAVRAAEKESTGGERARA